MQRILSENKLRHYYYHKKVCKKAYFPIKLTTMWGKTGVKCWPQVPFKLL